MEAGGVFHSTAVSGGGPILLRGYKHGLRRGLLCQIRDSQQVANSIPLHRAVVTINEFLPVKTPEEHQPHSLHAPHCYCH